MEEDQDCCGNCDYVLKTITNENWGYYRLVCRRYPPKETSNKNNPSFPKVGENNLGLWCGEHSLGPLVAHPDEIRKKDHKNEKKRSRRSSSDDTSSDFQNPNIPVMDGDTFSKSQPTPNMSVDIPHEC